MGEVHTGEVPTRLPVWPAGRCTLHAHRAHAQPPAATPGRPAAGVLPRLELGPTLFGVLGLATLLKLPLWWYCASLVRYSGAAEALAEDHINDVWANAGAVLTAALAAHAPRFWWSDPAGGILIAAVIIWRWALISASAVAKAVGVAAADDVLQLVQVSGHCGPLAALLRMLRPRADGWRIAAASCAPITRASGWPSTASSRRVGRGLAGL